jgi:crotonobetaine/carnitine-CoA ligase
MLIDGGSACIVDSFSVSRFWQQIRDSGSTTVFLPGVMANFVDRTPRSDTDRDHPLTKLFMAPWSTTWQGSRTGSASTCTPSTT